MNCSNPKCNTTGIPDYAKFCPVCGQALLFNVILLDPGKNILVVLKLIKELTGIGLKEAKDLIDDAPSIIVNNVNKNYADELCEMLISLGAKVKLSIKNRNDNANVILLDPGTNILAIVKLIYKSTGLGLKEAKDMVDTAPSVIQRNIDVNIADVLKMKMEKLGAMVAISHM